MSDFKNTVAHRDRLKEARNPGHHIGTFLLEHSNSPEYLISQLEGYLEAIKADLEVERAFFHRLSGRGRAERFAEKLKEVPWGHYRDVKFVRDYEGTATTTQFYGPNGETLDEPVDHPVAVKFTAGTVIHAGIMGTDPGKVTLEMEGYEYGVAYLHGLTADDIWILA